MGVTRGTWTAVEVKCDAYREPKFHRGDGVGLEHWRFANMIRLHLLDARLNRRARNPQRQEVRRLPWLDLHTE